MKIQKQIRGGVRGSGRGSQDGCEQKIEIFVKFKKKIVGVGTGLGWVRGDSGWM